MNDEMQLRDAMARQVDIRNVRFETRYKPDPSDPAKMKADDWVEWTTVAESIPATTSFRVAALKPRPGKAGAIEWPAVKPLYEAWLDGRAVTVDGTPFEAWNGLDAKEIEYLRRHMHCETLEQFAEMSETQVQRCQINGPRERVRRAQAFLAAQQTTGEIQRGFAERDTQIDALMAEIAALREQVGGQEDDDSAPRRRGPGRPRKAEAEAA
jgi:hypothetical protein